VVAVVVMNPPAFAVIATHDRPTMLLDAIDSLEPGVNVIVIDNAADPPVHLPPSPRARSVIRYDEQPPNLSHAWNLGLQRAADIATRADLECWDVAILNDDIVLPPRWLSTLSAAMRATRAKAAHVDVTREHGGPLINHIPGPVNLFERMSGWAFLLRGEAGLRFDEDLRWWFGDDDMDWRCRQAGGTMRVPYQQVVHHDPDGSTNRDSALQVQAGLDRETFAAKWRMTPW
jgi:GT2 family glycosyltransferase